MTRLAERFGKSFQMISYWNFFFKKVCTYDVVRFHGKLTTQKTFFIIKKVFALFNCKNSELKWGVIKTQEHLCVMEWFKGCLLSKGHISFILLKFVFNTQCILPRYWMRYIHWGNYVHFGLYWILIRGFRTYVALGIVFLLGYNVTSLLKASLMLEGRVDCVQPSPMPRVHRALNTRRCLTEVE